MRKLTVYECRRCGKEYTLLQRIKGIAPTGFVCFDHRCKGIVKLKANTDVPPDTIPTHEFVRMSRGEARRLDREHSGIFKFHKAGGLGIRRVYAKAAVSDREGNP